jgi:NAD(P)-dependent dehydrogenase (short-subunit alcohol dehydrogenase family)
MKTVLITGASRGIGRATALLCGARGWSVAITYLRDERAAEDAARATTAAGGRVATLQGDVAVEADVIRVFDAAENGLGRLDGVVINAGIVAPALPLADMSADRLRRVFEVNVLGAYLCARESARRLTRDRGGTGGSIVLVSSARLGSVRHSSTSTTRDPRRPWIHWRSDSQRNSGSRASGSMRFGPESSRPTSMRAVDSLTGRNVSGRRRRSDAPVVQRRLRRPSCGYSAMLRPTQPEPSLT